MRHRCKLVLNKNKMRLRQQAYLLYFNITDRLVDIVVNVRPTHRIC